MSSLVLPPEINSPGEHRHPQPRQRKLLGRFQRGQRQLRHLDGGVGNTGGFNAGTLNTGFFSAATQSVPNSGFFNLGTGNSGFGQNNPAGGISQLGFG
jgi:hypothetical protein